MNEQHNTSTRRPLGLRLICLVSFVYYEFLLTIFGLGVILYLAESSFLQKYIRQYQVSGSTLLLTNIIAFLTYVALFTGSIRMWMMKRDGFYIFLLGSVVIFIIQIFIGLINWINTTVNFFLIILFTIYLNKME